MANVNMASVFSKCKKWSNTAAGKKAMSDAVQRIVDGNSSHSNAELNSKKILTKSDMADVAQKLRDAIVSSASGCGLPSSVINSVSSLSAGELTEAPGVGYTIDLNFNKAMLVRPSLSSYRKAPMLFAIDTSEGRKYASNSAIAYNIVALLNHGYSASGSTYGYWMSQGRHIKSLAERPGTFFIDEAVSDFKNVYGSKYNIDVKVNDIY